MKTAANFPAVTSQNGYAPAKSKPTVRAQPIETTLKEKSNAY